MTFSISDSSGIISILPYQPETQSRVDMGRWIIDMSMCGLMV